MALVREYTGGAKLSSFFDDGTDQSVSVNLTPTGSAPTITFLCVYAGINVAPGYPISCVYGGVAGTLLTQTDGSASGLAVFYILNAPTGTQTFTALFSGAGGGADTIAAHVAISNYSGGELGASSAAGNGSSTTPSLTVSPAATSECIGFFLAQILTGSATTATVGAGETSRINTTTGTLSVNRVRVLCSTQAAGGDGVVNWTLAASRDWYGQVYEIAAVAAAATAKSGNFMMMGVG